ncbi:S1 RNA-binding domain-containing protein [Paenibacillus sp. P96]|uniref:S1 RNA-binding domain-containing protein n=1 Tax=Paenibacillus zeirhizosphaerae TaxID=2987519 RepID=A0ABT9FTX2_9BACL|nr:S1 RNA-binding domain-containing protein [Paenibacillus sp. P96]MDP4098161.1 S1 RNA-binding domain-containing protein [Paenibacillus sp. P96]
MDYIINKLNRNIDVSESGTIEKLTLLRERIEYSLFLIFGYLWNKNINEIDLNNRERIIANLDRISIGQVVEAIRILDINSEIHKSAKKILDKYPNVRNKAIGHGYTHSDKVENIENELDQMFLELYDFVYILKQPSDVILVESESEHSYKGIRLSLQDGGLPAKWSCPKELIGEENNVIERVFICIEGTYYKISPFIYLTQKGNGVYVFSSLFEKLSGGVKFCRLFDTENFNVHFPELVMISEDGEHRRISGNGTIMNYFEKNYTQFIDMTVKKTVVDFLTRDSSSVSATIWGHGGVGKTACIQSICNDFYNNSQRFFSYIIFMTAKDRKYDTKSGYIQEITNIRTYKEIISGIMNVIFDERTINAEESDLRTFEDKIKKFNNGKVLIVIDDYETFDDREKEKINLFIGDLNLLNHKVVITTRNKRLSIGKNISTTEFNSQAATMDFLKSVIKNEYPEHLSRIDKLLTSTLNVSDKIHDATSGRPIFIYQFAHLFAQRDYSDSLLKNLGTSENAQKFLYGKIYEHLSEKAQDAFVCISQIANESDMIFRNSVLEYLLMKDDTSQNELIPAAVEELTNQRVIEIYDEMYCRVYSKELLNMMLTNYQNRPPGFRDTVKNRLDSIGGTDVKGSIYDAMLNEANKSRNVGNEKETTEKYKRLLNEKKCPKSVKRAAIINLTSYLSNDRLDPEAAINVFKDNYNAFRDDFEVNKIYAQLLWSNSEEHKKEAVKNLKQFFHQNKKSDPKFLELFALTVGYTCNIIMNTKQKNSETEESQAKERLSFNALNKELNEYGRELFELVKNKTLNEFKPGAKHNIMVAILQVMKLCVEICKTDKSKLNYCKQMVEYSKKNFTGRFFFNIKRIEQSIEGMEKSWWESFLKEYKRGDIVECKINSIKEYGAFVSFGDSYTGMIHVSEISRNYIADITTELVVTQELQAKIISIDKIKRRINLSIKQLH